MAADAAGNDILNVFIPVTGFLAFAPYGTALPSTADMAAYGYTPPVAWKRAGLITVDGGFGWSDERADSIEFFQDSYQVSAGNGTATLAVKLAETSGNVRQLLRNATADLYGGMDIDVDADIRWALYTEEVDKNGTIRRRVAGNGWLSTAATNRSTRGEVNATEATFTIKRDPNMGSKHYREVIVPVDSTPNPYVSTVLPSGAAVGSYVAIRGAYLGTSGADISALTIDGVSVVTKVWVDNSLVMALVPAGVAGAAAVVLTTTSGGVSNSYGYTAA